MKIIIKFILLYFYICFSMFAICFIGEIVIRLIYYIKYSSCPVSAIDFKGIFAPAFIYGTSAWLLCVIYRINGWDMKGKKNK